MKYLTKSKFKIATECPTKIFYTGKKEYSNRNHENYFLDALAEGGYQVGELAKQYFPGGYDIQTLDVAEALAQTSELLEHDNVTIFEAAIRYENLLVRIDVLNKRGSHFDLIEVKAKSINTTDDSLFLTKKEKISSGWKPYLYDVAFQKYVLQSRFPDSAISAYLMLADKNSKAATESLNQKFRFKQVVDHGKPSKEIEVASTLNEEDIASRILVKVNVDELCDQIYREDDGLDVHGRGFVERINYYSQCYINDVKIPPELSSKCATCEFFEDIEQHDLQHKSGFHECWSEVLGWSKSDFREHNVLELWNFRKKDQFIKQGKIKFSQITEEDIGPDTSDGGILTTKGRQWLQVDKAKRRDPSIWIDKAGLRTEIDGWTYPLHFIDFETTMMAIPFNKGRHPYEGVAFQFSHHVLHEDGLVEHKGEYLNDEIGMFPNYEFVRRLKRELEGDEGTIFRYSAHENTFLNIIYEQLINEDDIDDKDELCDFIKSITHSKRGSVENWCGDRDMVDLYELVKWYYYNPLTNGSNSIKYVLPATLNSSDYLKEKYSQPIYGAEHGIYSFNFTNHIWIKMEKGEVVDPYKQLPELFESSRDIDLLSDSAALKDGGAAMTAYAKMQFEDMSGYERDELRKGLLRYCELDTLAMAMIVEAWVSWLSEE